MERLNAYSKRAPDGGVIVDIEGMAVDLITVLKADGQTKEMALANFAQLWDEVKVEIKIPDAAKN